MKKLEQFEIDLAVSYYRDGLNSFAAGEILDKRKALSFQSGWKDGKKLADI